MRGQSVRRPKGGPIPKSKLKGGNRNQRPHSAVQPGTSTLSTEKQTIAIAQRHPVQTWTAPQGLTHGSFQDAIKSMNGDMNGDHRYLSMWLYLPDEIWIGVLTWLSHKDLCQTAQVCRRFRQLTADETLCEYTIPVQMYRM
ncbi:hypothetical protein NDU88_002084 [Pleurodeles waltl]|uniref:F-box domain-containing protein n=1 Tax=Pleurodeles waltl TaxID=8319 RepID=A0AAV7VZM8_PLEWA|nr:hypothetical protein NDU88_002084 [Pleurodeles waltl]